MELLPLKLEDCEQEIWDWTKLNSYACMLRGHYAMEEHLVPKEPSEGLAFGISFHAMIEDWLKPVPHEYSSLSPALAFLNTWEKLLSAEHREKLELEGNRRSYVNAKRLFEAYKRKFPFTMFDDTLEVEVPFTLPLGITPRGRKIAWSGILDRVVIWQGETYYVDIKTSSYPINDKFFDKFRYNGQLLGYAWAGSQLTHKDFAGIMVHGIQVAVPQEGIKLKKDGTPYAKQGHQAEELIQSDIITIHPGELSEWKQKTLWKIDKIHEARETQYWEPDMGDLCSQFDGCTFQRLCYSPEKLREIRKHEHYETRKWNPLKRGEI